MGITMLIVAISVAAFYFWSKRRTRLLLSYEKATDRFYSSIKPLLDDDETPEEILSLLCFLNDQIVNTKGARGALIALLISDDRAEEIKQVRENKKVLRAFFDRRPELEKPFIEAACSALVAVILNGRGVTGILARLILKKIITKSTSAAPDYAENIYVHSGRNDGFGNCAPATG